MNLIDLIVVAACVVGIVTGYRRGALLAVFSFAGLLLGAVLGAQLVDPLAREFTDGSVTVRVPIALFCVLTLGIVGQLIGGWIGGTLRQNVTWRPAAQLDSVLGSFVSLAATLVVAWLIAVPLASASSPSLSAQVRDSHIVRGVDSVMPDAADELYASLRDYLDQSGFPRVFGALDRSQVSEVPPPDEALVNSAAVEAVRGSVLKIRAEAGSCDRSIEGSGFVYAPEHVLTNAHVVAGTDEVRVVSGEDSLRARVVLFDPRRDVAVLEVPGLTAAPLPFSAVDAPMGADAIVVGYPEDGPFDVRAARGAGPRDAVRPGHLRHRRRRAGCVRGALARAQRQLRRAADRPGRDGAGHGVRRGPGPVGHRVRAVGGGDQGRRHRRGRDIEQRRRHRAVRALTDRAARLSLRRRRPSAGSPR